MIFLKIKELILKEKVTCLNSRGCSVIVLGRDETISLPPREKNIFYISFCRRNNEPIYKVNYEINHAVFVYHRFYKLYTYLTYTAYKNTCRNNTDYGILHIVSRLL
jgi:hypothetical protein